MKIAVLGTLASSLVAFRGHLIEAMRKHGHEVHCGAADFDDESRKALRAIGVASCQELPLRRTGTNPLHDGQAIFALIAWLEAVKPELLLAYTSKAVNYGGLAARLCGVREFYPLISGLGYAFIDERDHRRALLRSVVCRLYKLSLSRATVTLFQNVDDEREFRARGILRAGQQSLITHGSGVDLDYYAPAPLPPSSEPPAFLFIGRLLWEKGVGELITAARILKRMNARVRIQLLGGLDPNPSSLSRQELSKLQSDGTVEYLGAVKDVRPHIANSSAMVFPSYYREGTPRAVLEAMSMGRAIVTTDVPGCREAVIHGINGLVVPARHPVALAHSILRLTSRFALARMGRKSRELAEAKYDVNEVNEHILDALKLRGRAPAAKYTAEREQAGLHVHGLRTRITPA